MLLNYAVFADHNDEYIEYIYIYIYIYIKNSVKQSCAVGLGFLQVEKSRQPFRSAIVNEECMLNLLLLKTY